MKQKRYYYRLLKIVKRFLNKLVEKQKKTLEFKPNKSSETFSFNPPIPIEGSWMISLMSLDVCNSLFDINTTTSKFEFYKDTFAEFSYTELKCELEEILDISKITCEFLQSDVIGPRIISTHAKLETKKHRLMFFTSF